MDTHGQRDESIASCRSSLIRRSPTLVCGLLFLLGVFGSLHPSEAWGIIALRHDLELEGFFKTENILRESLFQDMKWIMQRNTAQIESKYNFLRDSLAFDRFQTGRLEEASLTLIGRGVYDSIYDLSDAYRKPYTKSERDHRKFELDLREAFMDIALPPLTLRLGRQQVVWGETDNFRALDVINPLDLSWHWSWEPWEDIRIPLWMLRAIYDIGKLEPLEESFVEVIWIPWDFRRNKITTDPHRPWPFIGDGLFERANSVIINNELFNLEVDERNQKPGKKIENSQAGLRFKAIWGGIDFSLNYFYTFSADTGVKFRSDMSEIVGDTFHAVIDTVNPRSHVVGISANYSEERYTQAVFRLETTLTSGVPVTVAADAPARIDPDHNQFDTARRSVLMLAFDRPTWIRPLNSLRTFFISGQVFWRHYWDYSRFYRGVFAVRRAILNDEVVPDRFVQTNTVKLQQDEMVMTLSASTIYGPAGLWQPLFVVAFDPFSTGVYNQISLDYLFSNHIVLRLTQNFFWRVRSFDPGPWALGDLFGRPRDSRHETVFSIIFQF